MNFRPNRIPEEPEINFVPLIDLLLVILIFVMVTMTFSRYTQLKVDLPSASATATAEEARDIVVAVSADGQYRLADRDPEPLAPGALVAALRDEAAKRENRMVVIYADAGATHQAVVGVLDAARQAGLERVTFAAQGEPAPR
ncbi:MAG: biopolymer transporter ExbD [Burkholderiaceae bacterium]